MLWSCSGPGILTAGYFVAPSPDEELEKKADEQAAQRVGHRDTAHRRHMGIPLFLFVHSRGYAGWRPARSPAMPTSPTAAAFGGTGRAIGAGGS